MGAVADTCLDHLFIADLFFDLLVHRKDDSPTFVGNDLEYRLALPDF